MNQYHGPLELPGFPPGPTNLFLWSEGTFHPIPGVEPPAIRVGAAALAEDSTILGWVTGLDGRTWPAILRADAWETLEVPVEFTGATGRDLDTLGTVCGSANPVYTGSFVPQQPAVWRHGAFERLPLPDDPLVSGGYAVAINEQDQIVGSASLRSWNPKSSNWVHSSHAVLWDRGVAIDLHPASDPSSTGFDIASGGLVLAQATRPPGLGEPTYSFLWTRSTGRRVLQGTVEFKSAVALAVNHLGQAVGWAYDKAGEQIALLWRHDQPLPLPSTIQGGLPKRIKLRSGIGINARGQILCQGQETSGYRPRLYLLDPVTD